LEAVSSRLRQVLIHLNRRGAVRGVLYSPDGQRIIAGDYPGGVVQVWDAVSGKQLTSIETGYGYRSSSEYFFLSPDWKTVYVDRETRRKHVRIEKDGKKMIRWDCAGEVRAWDLASGQLRRTYSHTPPRGIDRLTFSPDGSLFVTSEELSGESGGAPNRSSTLWDTRTGNYRLLPEGLGSLDHFSPDNGTLAIPALDENHRLTAIKLFDVKTAREKLSLAIPKEGISSGFMAFSPDGRLFIGEPRNYKTGEHWLKFWDAKTGRELASITGVKKDYFMWLAFSPDGRTLATTNLGETEPAKVFLFDLPSGKLAKTILLGEKASVRQPVFSPDGKWIALATQVFPPELRGRDPEPEDVPQPRIHLIDVAAGAVRETLVAPPGFTASLCFSPDGKTLASDGQGRVLLWDLTRP
jgi:WD40 repeat protein